MRSIGAARDRMIFARAYALARRIGGARVYYRRALGRSKRARRATRGSGTHHHIAASSSIGGMNGHGVSNGIGIVAHRHLKQHVGIK